MKMIIFMALFNSHLGLAADTATEINPISIKVGYEERDIFPWHYGKRRGHDFDILNSIDNKTTEIEFKYYSLSWKRCLEQLKTGIIDACFAASFNKFRDELAIFPKTHGVIDSRFALHWESYAIFHKKGSKISYNGSILKEGASVSACTMHGHSVNSELKGRGVEVVSVSGSILQCLKMLNDGRVDVVVNHKEATEQEIKNNNFKDIIRNKVRFSYKPNYLIFSKNFFSKNTKISWEVWRKIKKFHVK